MVLVLFAVMYFLMIRPQQKRDKQHREQLSKLQVGDKVVTIGRLHGVVDEIHTAEKTVTLDCDGIFLTFDMNAIATVKERSVAPTEPTTPTEEKSEPVDSDKPATEDKTDDSETK